MGGFVSHSLPNEAYEAGLIFPEGYDSTMSLSEIEALVRAQYNFPKIELHLHLDGAIRFETILDLAAKKGISLRGATTVDELKRLVVTHTPANLAKVLEAFDIFSPVIVGDAEALERVAYELAEDQAKEGVIYFEARYAPFLLLGKGDNKLTPRAVVEAIFRGLERGKKDFGVDSRSILCMIRGLDGVNKELVELAASSKSLGVVAIDVAGSAHGADEQYEPSVIQAFKDAYARGVHRTVHAGESGGSKEVLIALNEMHAERIGHGYRILRDEDAYVNNFVRDRRAHLEACPYSSVMTGAVPLDWPHHPIVRWAADDVSFSISRDDPTCFDNKPSTELHLTRTRIGLSLHQLWKCQLNAANAAFLTDEEKKPILDKILAAEPPK